MVLYCNFRSLAFLGLFYFLIQAAKSLIVYYPPKCSQGFWQLNFILLARGNEVLPRQMAPRAQRPLHAPVRGLGFWVLGFNDLGFRVQSPKLQTLLL